MRKTRETRELLDEIRAKIEEFLRRVLRVGPSNLSLRAFRKAAEKAGRRFLGTFCLVFAGTGAIVIDGVTGGGVSHVGVALTFGLIVLAMIYNWRHLGCAH